MPAAHDSACDTFHWQCYIPEIILIHQLKFVGTNPNSMYISFWICTAGYREIWVLRCGGFRECCLYSFSGHCHSFQWKLSKRGFQWKPSKRGFQWKLSKRALSALSECVGRGIPRNLTARRGGGLGSRPKKMYGERLGDGVEYHLMSPTPRR